MVANSSARLTRIFIGGKDFTGTLVSFSGSDNHIDQSGLVSFTGTVVLNYDQALDITSLGESLDDRVNTTRFCRGVEVLIDVRNNSGTFVRHPRGALRILTPFYDAEQRTQTLEVGDLIALLSFKEPTDPEVADNKNDCDGRPANEVITNLLNEAGITSITGTLPTTKYNYPLNLSGSYIQSVGKILYANNSYGWINSSEEFNVLPVITSGLTAVDTITQGTGELWYRRLNGSELPVEKVRMTGTEVVVRPINTSVNSFQETYGRKSDLVPDIGTDGDIVLSSVTQNVFLASGGSSLSFNLPEGITGSFVNVGFDVTLVDEKATIFEIFPEIIKTTYSLESQQFFLRTKELDYRYKVYDTQCRLIADINAIIEPKGAYYDEYVGDVGFVSIDPVNEFDTTSFTVITYAYDDGDRNILRTTRTTENILKVLSGQDINWNTTTFDPDLRVETSVITESWREINKGVWEKAENTRQILLRANSSLLAPNNATDFADTNALSIISSTRTTRSSTAGQETPPATERCPSSCTYEENNIEEFAEVTGICASGLKERERTYQVDLLPGQLKPALSTTLGYYETFPKTAAPTETAAALQAIAKRESRLLFGRWKGQEVGQPLNNTILSSYYPLIPISVVEFGTPLPGAEQLYIADGASWSVTTEESLWSFDGVWIGTISGGVVTQPFTEKNIYYLGDGDGIEPKIFPYAAGTTNNTAVELGDGDGIEGHSFELTVGQLGDGDGVEGLSFEVTLGELGDGDGVEVQLTVGYARGDGDGIEYSTSTTVTRSLGDGDGIEFTPSIVTNAELGDGDGVEGISVPVTTAELGDGDGMKPISLPVPWQQVDWDCISELYWNNILLSPPSTFAPLGDGDGVEVVGSSLTNAELGDGDGVEVSNSWDNLAESNWNTISEDIWNNLA